MLREVDELHRVKQCRTLQAGERAESFYQCCMVRARVEVADAIAASDNLGQFVKVVGRHERTHVAG